MAVGPNGFGDGTGKLGHSAVIDWGNLTSIEPQWENKGLNDLSFGLPAPGEARKPGA